MFEAIENIVNSLGTATLLGDLDGAIRILESLNSTGSESAVTVLLEQIKDLIEITASIHELSTDRRRNSSATLGFLSASDLIHLRPVLYGTAATTEECSELISALQSSLNGIAQERSLIGYVTPESRLKNQPWYSEIYKALGLRTEVLRLLSSAINLLYHKHDADENGNLTATARNYASTLQFQITLVEPKLHNSAEHDTIALRSAIAAAKAVTIHVPASTNKHFAVARSVKSFYTGREKQMAKLKTAFEDTTYIGQKRFVIYGLGGSGKTELAIKYAEEYQDRIWGVFFVDGSSRKNASGSYSEIATIGGVEPNEKAAKMWLRTRDLPWLLIIDNVDDDEVNLDDLLPSGSKGSILITSRNPAHKSYGNVGQRFLELRPMEKEEAHELILKAAEEPRPWAVSVKDCATTICQALGFLPLALVHAAKAILTDHCTWPGYLTYYERQIQRIRRGRLHRRDRSLSRNKNRLGEDSDSISVFSTYEILYQSLQSSQEERFRDAVELLHVFSFLHFQNIRLDILLNASTNPFKEAQQREKDAKEDQALQRKITNRKPKSWGTWLRELSVGLARCMDTPPPLPAVLKNSDGLKQSVFENEVHIRLSEAMSVLTKRSLVMKQDRVEDRYSMHPLVHKWVRERPEMLISHQALWCQVAMTTLAKSILLPPLDDTGVGRKTRRELLPHIVHVRNCQVTIADRLEENKGLRNSFWPTTAQTSTRFGRLQADQFARFSRVYSECGLFDEALQLQLRVRSFVADMLGEDHPLSIRLTLFASGTLWELSRTTEATQFQRRAYQNCKDSLGEHHPLTLDVTDLLGSALLLKGRYTEAHTLHKKNVEEVRKLYGEHHEKTFKALRSLGRVHSRWMEYEEASRLHQIAWEGMKECLGETHLETLSCLEDLAMSFVRHDGEPYENMDAHLVKSHERMEFVYDQRRRLLGREQPYTLLAYFYWAQVKAACHQQEEAERMMREVISTAGVNVSEEHTVVLAAKAHYARVLTQLGRCDEAAELLRTLILKPQYRRTTDEDGDHPDRIAAMWFLAGCQEKQDKIQDALDSCEEMLAALQGIGGNGRGMNHKFRLMLLKKIDELRIKPRESS
ncbi:hypothetical protein EJ08DRAFT_697146 [Tothia fuscella]|uniref:AAA+ ATPase domain-containing protein n=1 Tax=Tothia fuscella TaxID=1048955 RepID=A0A9P4NSN1_9PEZI|nr:hypothetical protein EJ08DRAFT_697146 [Tothia fuscella]